MKFTTFTIELMADTSTPLQEAKAFSAFQAMGKECDLKVTRKLVRQESVSDLFMDLTNHYLKFGKLPKRVGPKQVGSNEYKRIHKRVKKIMATINALNA